jgi:ribonucleoside-diphosphate reductase alpha subunit
MKILKRDNNLEQLSFDKIISRLRNLCNDTTLGPLLTIDSDPIAQRVVSSIYDGITSQELDEEAARISIGMTENIEYAKLASRILISNLHKSTMDCFSDVMESLYNNTDKANAHTPVLADDVIDVVRKHKDQIDSVIDYNRDYLFDYFGFKTLEKSYLVKLMDKESGKMRVVERPQHLYMRVAIGIHKDDIQNAIKTYHYISQHFYTHASPTMFNAGTRLANLSSCFLVGSQDSIEGIYKTITDCGRISKVGGGIGVHISNIRAKGSIIRGTNGVSDGIIPMIKVYNATSVYVNQCILPHIPVYSKDGIKRMDQITTQDFLLTNDGSFKKVNEVIVNHKSEEILKIHNACEIDPLICTKVHDIYTIKCDQSVDLTSLKTELQNDIKKPTFVEASELTTNDYLGYPIPTFEQDNEFWTEKMCRLIAKKTGKIATDVLHLPLQKVAQVVTGLFECNGRVTETGVWFMDMSAELAKSLKYICLRFGILATTSKSSDDSYHLRIPSGDLHKFGISFQNQNEEPADTYFEYDGMLWCRIKKIEKEMYTGKVYDFNMIDNHNYLTDMGLVHNSGRRKGSFAMYIEPWHADVMDFLELKKNQGHEDVRARDLFYALWVPDLFMKQVESNGDWYLMCPDECPNLSDVYGQEFEDLYWRYVEEKRYKKVVKAQDVWKKVLDSQIETGVPYIGYKDSVNKKCNQKNLGTIKSSNLCLEISLHSDDKEYAVCNLASIALPKYVEYDDTGKPVFNFYKLKEVAEYIVTPMNKVIDNNYYPTEETKKSNMEHRPLGIGVQGLSDVYIKMRVAYESQEAKVLNKEIFETIYYGCLQGSINEAKKYGRYNSFEGSPFSQGKLQFDLAEEFDGIKLKDYLSGRWDWEFLKKELVEHGARNSMLVALMPTASSAQIMGNCESFEAYDSCIFKRRVLSGEYLVINKYLLQDLTKLGLWSKEMKEKIIAHNGSIQDIDEIPKDLKTIYKTVWEISMKSIIEQCSDRGVFVDQMQSMNLFMANPTYKKLTSMHFYAWNNRLKSGMYYLRSKSSANAGKFSIDANLEKKIRDKQEKGKRLTKEEEKLICSIENKDECMACSS